MEFGRYQSLLAQSPQLEHCLHQLIGPEAFRMGDHQHPDFTFRQWVERFVDRIDIVPLDALSLQAVNVGRLAEAEYTQYVTFWHIENEVDPEYFGRRTYCQPDDATLQTTLSTLCASVESWLAQPECAGVRAETVIDLVVRHSRLRDMQPQKDAPPPYYHEELQLFFFQPEDSRKWLAECPS